MHSGCHSKAKRKKGKEIVHGDCRIEVNCDVQDLRSARVCVATGETVVKADECSLVDDAG